MSSHGKQIMQAVTLILEGEHSIEVKEQVRTEHGLTETLPLSIWQINLFLLMKLLLMGKFLRCTKHFSLFFSLQTLCILANIADGNTAKELIMTNDDMLQKVKYYMV